MDNQIRTYYELETEVFRLTLKAEETEQSLRQAKYDCREATVALTEYEGSLRSFLDGLSGKKADKLDALRRTEAHAKQTLSGLTQESERLTAKQEELTAALKALPSFEELKKSAFATPEKTILWATLEAKLCAEKLLSVLQKNWEALEEFRQQMRGNRMHQITTREQIYEVGAAHIPLGEESATLLHRMKEPLALLNQPLEIPHYFLSPAAYIESAAARHNRLDRISKAQQQVEDMQREMKKLLE